MVQVRWSVRGLTPPQWPFFILPFGFGDDFGDGSFESGGPPIGGRVLNRTWVRDKDNRDQRSSIHI